MGSLLSLLLPFFALVLIGWVAARKGLLPVEGIGALMVFVLYFALSALLFRLGAGGRLQAGPVWGLLAVYALSSAVVTVAALVWSVRCGMNRRDAGMAALVAAFPNTGFLGLPLLTGLLGPGAAGPVAATLLVDVILTCSCCVAWIHAGAEGGGDALASLRASLRGALRNPLLQAMAAGITCGALGWVVPTPVDDTLRLLGQAATPAALFTLGAIVARAQMRARAQPSARAPRLSGLLIPVSLKLAVHPALVWGMGRALQAMGHPLSDMGLVAVTLAAALPAAANVSMLAEREGADTGLIARIILWTTAGSVLTLLGWCAVLGVKQAV